MIFNALRRFVFKHFRIRIQVVPKKPYTPRKVNEAL